MIEDDVDAIIQWYDRFLDSVRQVAMNAEEQKEKLSGFVATDEIASDFSDIGMVYAKKLLQCGWITQKQFMLAESIDKKFDEMSKKRNYGQITRYLYQRSGKFAEKWEENL